MSQNLHYAVEYLDDGKWNAFRLPIRKDMYEDECECDTTITMDGREYEIS